jgi:hypothetical protein
MTTTSTASNLPFQAGVIGTNTQLTVFVARVPNWLKSRGGEQADPTLQSSSDIRRVTYYMSSSGRGLCRQERDFVTADGVGNSTDPDYSTEDVDMIAPEVVGLSFEYASGTGWMSDWDGSMNGTDGTSMQGPPRAIRVTLTLEGVDGDGLTVTRTVVHVIALRTAGGTTAPPTDTTMPDTTDTTTTPTTTTP